MMAEKPRHARLSDALCEAVEFGYPTLIRIGPQAMTQLLASIDRDSLHKTDLGREPKFENVRVSIEPGFNGCVVEHDNRYTGLRSEGPATATPDTVAMMRDTRKPAIIAWKDEQ